MRRYTVILEPDIEDGGFVVNVHALPGCRTQGDSVEQTLTRAEEAIRGYVTSLIDEGLEVPEELVSPLLISLAVA